MKIIDKKLLDEITVQAKENERLRKNYNFHEHLDAKAQRLLNAMEPGTAFPIHRHLTTAETYLLLRGNLKVMLYDDSKKITDTIMLNIQEGKLGVHIPAGQWHTLEVLESGTVIFEVKDGPYKPLDSTDIL